MCPICFDDFSETPDQAVYKTDCGHVFHNNCLNKYCTKNERRGNPQICPMCRKDLNTKKSDQCTDVWTFKNKALDTSSLDQKNRAIYDAQPDDTHDDDDDDDDDADGNDGNDDDDDEYHADVNNNERRVARRIDDYESDEEV